MLKENTAPLPLLLPFLLNQDIKKKNHYIEYSLYVLKKKNRKEDRKENLTVHLRRFSSLPQAGGCTDRRRKSFWHRQHS